MVDGSRYIIKKGGELMGLLFNNFENKYVARGRKEGLSQGEERADARWSAWIADNPELKKLIEEGKVVAPPGLGDDLR